MRIEYTQNPEDVRELLERWGDVCRADEFGFDVSVEAALTDMRIWMERCPGSIILARDDDESPLGFLMVVAVQSNLGPQVMALEKYWYADPNYKLAGAKLLNEAHRWAESQGCSHLILAASNLSSEHFSNIAHFCESMGMREFERTYICEV